MLQQPSKRSIVAVLMLQLDSQGNRRQLFLQSTVSTKHLKNLFKHRFLQVGREGSQPPHSTSSWHVQINLRSLKYKYGIKEVREKTGNSALNKGFIELGFPALSCSLHVGFQALAEQTQKEMYFSTHEKLQFTHKIVCRDDDLAKCRGAQV